MWGGASTAGEDVLQCSTLTPDPKAPTGRRTARPRDALSEQGPGLGVGLTKPSPEALIPRVRPRRGPMWSRYATTARLVAPVLEYGNLGRGGKLRFIKNWDFTFRREKEKEASRGKAKHPEEKRGGGGSTKERGAAPRGSCEGSRGRRGLDTDTSTAQHTKRRWGGASTTGEDVPARGPGDAEASTRTRTTSTAQHTKATLGRRFYGGQLRRAIVHATFYRQMSPC